MHKIRHFFLSLIHATKTYFLILHKLIFGIVIIGVTFSAWLLRDMPYALFLNHTTYQIITRINILLQKTPFFLKRLPFPSPLPLFMKNRALEALQKGLWLSLGLLLILGLFMCFHKRGGSASKPKLISARRLKWALKMRFQKSSISINKLHLPKGFETQHTLIMGTTGAGKTNALNHLAIFYQEKRSFCGRSRLHRCFFIFVENRRGHLL